MGLRLERVPEEDEEVDLALGDERAELLVAAERAALELADRRLELGLEQRAGRPGRDEAMGDQHLAVVVAPLDEVGLLVVVGHEADRLGQLDHGVHGASWYGGSSVILRPRRERGAAARQPTTRDASRRRGPRPGCDAVARVHRTPAPGTGAGAVRW